MFILEKRGLSPISFAAWAPDTDKRNAMSTDALAPNNNYQETIHLLDGVNDPTKVLAAQQKLAEQVTEILQTIKQYENDPAKKAAYLTNPSVQNTLHAFGDAFAHIDGDGTHYSSGRGHAHDSLFGDNPDNPATHPEAYRDYVNSLFKVATHATNISRVSDDVIKSITNRVITTSSEAEQTKVLDSSIGSVSSSTSSSLVNSPVSDCGYLKGCSDVPIGDRVRSLIYSTYGVKK